MSRKAGWRAGLALKKMESAMDRDVGVIDGTVVHICLQPKTL